jgi:threonine dehydrogenase-like Zn-dependent dehydrogenase
METIYFDVNIPKILATKTLAKLFPPLFYSPLSPVSYGKFPDPVLPGPRWVRIRNRLAGICGTDLSMFFVDANPTISVAALPGVPRLFMGHEVVGRVEEIGDEVSELMVGDRVVMQSYLPCCSVKDIDPWCPSCQEGNYCTCENFSEGAMPGNTGAGFSDQFVGHEAQLLKVPDDITDTQAVLIEPAAVSLRAVLKRPPLTTDNVLVIGAGTIGLNVIQFTKTITPECRISVMEPIAFKQPLALELGADQVLTGEPYEDVSNTTGGKLYHGALGNTNLLGGFDVVYDCVGKSKTIHNSLRWLRAGGDYVMIGNQLAPVAFDQTPLWHQELRMIGTNSHGMETHNGRQISTFELVIEMIHDGRINLDPLITNRFRLEDYKAAFNLARSKSEDVIKIVFDMT